MNDRPAKAGPLSKMASATTDAFSHIWAPRAALWFLLLSPPTLRRVAWGYEPLVERGNLALKPAT
jgi:hypothetical protein